MAYNNIINIKFAGNIAKISRHTRWRSKRAETLTDKVRGLTGKGATATFVIFLAAPNKFGNYSQTLVLPNLLSTSTHLGLVSSYTHSI